MPLICYVSDQWGSIRSPYLGHGEVTGWWLAAHPAHQPELLLKSDNSFFVPKFKLCWPAYQETCGGGRRALGHGADCRATTRQMALGPMESYSYARLAQLRDS